MTSIKVCRFNTTRNKTIVEVQTTTTIADKLGQHLYENPGLPDNAPEIIQIYRAAVYDYVVTSHLGEHLNCYLFESVRTSLEQSECELTDAQKTLFIEYLDEQIPEFESITAAFIEAYSRDFESNVVDFVETLTSKNTNNKKD